MAEALSARHRFSPKHVGLIETSGCRADADRIDALLLRAAGMLQTQKAKGRATPLREDPSAEENVASGDGTSWAIIFIQQQETMIIDPRKASAD